MYGPIGKDRRGTHEVSRQSDGTSPNLSMLGQVGSRQTLGPFKSVTSERGLRVNYHDDIYGPEVHEVGPHVVSCMLYIQVIVKA